MKIKTTKIIKLLQIKIVMSHDQKSNLTSTVGRLSDCYLAKTVICVFSMFKCEGIATR